MSSQEWSRAVPWRQGSFLPNDQELGFASSSLLIVISHDCDCVNDPSQEPSIEIIQAALVDRLEGNYANAKHPRILHLPVTVDGIEQCIELRSTAKSTISKSLLVGKKPLDNVSLDGRKRKVLALWLASRYSRMTFPEALVDRMRPVESAFKKAAEAQPAAILGIYVAFSPEGEIDVNQEPYEIDVVVVFDSSQVGASDAAKQTAGKIEAAFQKEYRKVDDRGESRWYLMDLRLCIAVSDTEFTLHDLLRFSMYRLDHISLKQVPPTTVAPLA